MANFSDSNSSWETLWEIHLPTDQGWQWAISQERILWLREEGRPAPQQELLEVTPLPAATSTPAPSTSRSVEVQTSPFTSHVEVQTSPSTSHREVQTDIWEVCNTNRPILHVRPSVQAVDTPQSPSPSPPQAAARRWGGSGITPARPLHEATVRSRETAAAEASVHLSLDVEAPRGAAGMYTPTASPRWSSASWSSPEWGSD